MLAARGTAIVVNSARKVKSLTLDQVRDVFGGKVKDWGDLGAAGGKIHCYAPPLTDAASALFHKKVLPSVRWAAVRRRKGAAAVLSAVATDPDAVALVSVLDVQKANKLVKVLRIKAGQLDVWPSPWAVRNGRYAIAEQLYLYVSPKASNTTKDFVKFILSGACDKTYRAHGLVAPPRPAAKGPTKKPAPKKPAKKPSPTRRKQ